MANGLTISCWVEDTNPTTVNLTGNKNMLIRHHSTAKASMYAPDGSALDLDMSYIKNGGKTVWGVEGTFPNVVSNVFDFAAMDSDNRIASQTVEAQMVDYMKLTCHAIESRPDATGNMTLQCVGDYFNNSFGASSNTIEVTYRYRVKGGTWGSYYSMSVSATGNYYTAYATLSGLNYQASYDFEIVAKDRLMEAKSTSNNVVSKPVFHWGENDVAFEVPVSFNEGVEYLNVKDTLELGNQGNARIKTGIRGDMVITAPSINLNTSELMQNGTVISSVENGTWTPQLSCSGVYTNQMGWYIKSSSIVVAGFYIKIECDSGYQGSDIKISGLPFTPLYSGSGGGICSGAYVSAGFNFQCFVADMSGSITARVQACNNTSAGNLATSASGCKYPYGGGTLTLSGTVTYMAW